MVAVAHWKLSDRRLDLDGPLGVGIVNVTVDSMFEGARSGRPERAIEDGVALAKAGFEMLDVGEGNRLLAERGHNGLRLIDNGAIFAPMEGIDGPAHAYHLLPEGASKANAVAFHMRARGFAPEECIAIGDSVEDLDVAGVVGRFFMPANGPERDPALREAIGGRANVTVTEGRMGEGVYEAIVSTLAGA